MAINPSPTPSPDIVNADVVQLTQQLLQIDTTNPGHNDGPGEIDAARWVQARLAEVGIDSELFTTTAEHRAGVAALIPGTDPTEPPIMLTGHLDVVPAVAEEWTHPPLSGHLDDDGVLWGRGAVDMKGTVAMYVAIVRAWQRAGIQPRRSVALLFTPDEEAGGWHGAHWIVEHRPELLFGATEALGEVGGYSVTLPNGRRIYPIQTGEKGLAWITATVPGISGHGSILHTHNPVELLVRAVDELIRHPYGVSLTPSMQTFADIVSEILGEEISFDDPARLREQLGGFARVIGASVRTTINPTMLNAGVKHNIVPSTASAGMDVRFLPGTEDEVLSHIRQVFPPETTMEFANLDIGLESPFDGPLIAAIQQALTRADPEGIAVPYLMTGGTDGKSLSKAGIRYVGFSPLYLGADSDFFSLFHGVDERVPASALIFGQRVLDDVVRSL